MAFGEAWFHCCSLHQVCCALRKNPCGLSAAAGTGAFCSEEKAAGAIVKGVKRGLHRPSQACQRAWRCRWRGRSAARTSLARVLLPLGFCQSQGWPLPLDLRETVPQRGCTSCQRRPLLGRLRCRRASPEVKAARNRWLPDRSLLRSRDRRPLLMPLWVACSSALIWSLMFSSVKGILGRYVKSVVRSGKCPGISSHLLFRVNAHEDIRAVKARPCPRGEIPSCCLGCCFQSGEFRVVIVFSSASKIAGSSSPMKVAETSHLNVLAIAGPFELRPGFQRRAR